MTLCIRPIRWPSQAAQRSCTFVVQKKGEQGADLGLWVAAPAYDWQHIMSLGFENQAKLNEYSDGLISQAVEAACNAGFTLQGSTQGKPMATPCCCVGSLARTRRLPPSFGFAPWAKKGWFAPSRCSGRMAVVLEPPLPPCPCCTTEEKSTASLLDA